MEETFRIKQNGDNDFIIQKKVIKIKRTGYLWWKKEEKNEMWTRVDKYGTEYYNFRMISNYDLMETHKTLKDAQKWVKDYHKYPLYIKVESQK